MRPFSFFLSWLAAVTAVGTVAAQDVAQAPQRLRSIEIVRQDVFGTDHTERYFFARLINLLHATTREATIARELWVGPGDAIDAATVAEIERNLRSLGIFAEVTATLVPTDDPREVDLRIATKDKLSLSFGGGASYVGGVSGFRAQIGEGNLFGRGDRIITSFSQNSDGEYRGSIAYTDLHLLDTWHTATIRASRSDEGESFGLEVRRPIKHLADPRGYGGSLRNDREEIEYYRLGDTAATVDQHTQGIAADVTWAAGPADDRLYHGFLAQVVEAEYGPATGPLAPEIRVPGDTRSAYLGLHARWERIDGFREVRGFDTLDYVQDLQLGTTLAGQFGARVRDEDGQSRQLQPELAFGASWATEVFTGVYATTAANGRARWHSGEAVGWQSNLAAWLYVVASHRNTLTLSVNHDAAEEDQDLPIEFTLGEDNGLRGYSARQLAGTRRLRANLENRFDTSVEYATFRLGLVAFFDCGWIGDGDDLDGPYRSVGGGLRIGSSSLLGGSVLRLDLAKPLDDAPGDDDEWKLSITVGQVFTFGGYASALSTR